MEMLEIITNCFVLLFPGFIAFIIINAIIIRDKLTRTQWIIEPLALSSIVYMFYSLLTDYTMPVDFTKGSPKFEGTALAILLAISLVVGFLLGFFIYKNYFYIILSKLNLTLNKFPASVWRTVFSHEIHDNTRVVINFTTGQQLFGAVTAFSNDENSRFLYLTDYTWLITEEMKQKNGKQKNRQEEQVIDVEQKLINGILITPEMKIQSIEFIQEKDKKKEKKKFLEKMRDYFFSGFTGFWIMVSGFLFFRVSVASLCTVGFLIKPSVYGFFLSVILVSFCCNYT